MENQANEPPVNIARFVLQARDAVRNLRVAGLLTPDESLKVKARLHGRINLAQATRLISEQEATELRGIVANMLEALEV